jgi:Putative zinc-finger
MTHLGRWLSALIDGELDAAERDHILNHLAGCDACLREANALRALKRRMNALGDTSSDSDSDSGPDVVRRLIDLGRLDPLAVGGTSFTESGRVSEFAASARQPAWLALPARLGWKLATGSAGATFLAIGLAAFMLGAPATSPRPQVTPALDVYWVEHVHDMGQGITKPGAPRQLGSAGSGAELSAPSKPSVVKSASTKPTALRVPAARRRTARRHAVRKRAVSPRQFAFHGLSS